MRYNHSISLVRQCKGYQESIGFIRIEKFMDSLCSIMATFRKCPGRNLANGFYFIGVIVINFFCI